MRLRTAGLLVALLGLVTPALAPTAAVGDDDPAPLTIVGADGATYPVAPGVVTGRKRELFFGPAFDQYCEDSRATFEGQVRQLAKLAKVIRSSGRRVVFTIVPDKPHAAGAKLSLGDLPHGKCDRFGLRERANVMRTFADPSYLPLGDALDAEAGRMYWKTDAHWTTMGAAVYARELARRLDPELAQATRFVKAESQTRLWPMAVQEGRTAETVAAVKPGWKVRVKEKRDHYDVTGVDTFADHIWRSRPAARTWRGRTLVLGDSMTFLALRGLRPLFERGRFLWIGPASVDRMRDAIVDADTVVIEVAEFLLPISSATQDSFRESVREALAQ